MTITTVRPTSTTHALDMSVTIRDSDPTPRVLDIRIPSADALAVLYDIALASGIERGIVAAGVLERLAPYGVELDERTCGTNRDMRCVYLHHESFGEVSVMFFHHTASVMVHIDADDDCDTVDGMYTPEQMFDLVRAHYDS